MKKSIIINVVIEGIRISRPYSVLDTLLNDNIINKVEYNDLINIVNNIAYIQGKFIFDDYNEGIYDKEIKEKELYGIIEKALLDLDKYDSIFKGILDCVHNNKTIGGENDINEKISNIIRNTKYVCSLDAYLINNKNIVLNREEFYIYCCVMLKMASKYQQYVYLHKMLKKLYYEISYPYIRKNAYSFVQTSIIENKGLSDIIDEELQNIYDYIAKNHHPLDIQYYIFSRMLDIQKKL